MDWWWAVAAAAVFAGLVAFGYVWVRLGSLRRAVAEAWDPLDAALARRADLVPSLVEASRAFVGHERSLITETAWMRARMAREGCDAPERRRRERDLAVALRQQRDLADGYADLRGRPDYVQVRGAMDAADAEVRASLAAFNERLEAYNGHRSRPLACLVAALGRFRPGEPFDLPGAA